VTETPRAPSAAVGESRELWLDLRLLSTAVSDDPASSVATIHDLARDLCHVLGNGDPIPEYENVSVAEIAPRRVWIDADGRSIELRLSEAPPPPAPLPDEDQLRTLARMPGRLDAANAQQWEEHAAAVTAVLAGRLGERNREALYSQGNFAPAWDADGREMVGILVTWIAPGSFFDQLGLREGDVIEELNGIRLDDLDAAEEIMSHLTDATVLDLVVRGPEGVRTLRADPAPPR
jgi:type II secretion system protein C